MGRKVNPKIIRLSSVNRVWESMWFSDRRVEYRTNLKDDLLIRKFVESKLRMASVARLEIVRNQKEIVLTIHSSRPAVVIGRGGSGIEEIQKALGGLIGRTTKIRINVQEVRNPDTDATALMTQIVDQLEKRMPFRRTLKWSVSRAMQAGAKGVRVSMAGRLNGAEIARTEWLAEGSVPLHTFRADISYAAGVANTTYGTIGVKVWVHRGDLLDKNEDQEVKPQQIVKKKEKMPRRRKSLADKVATKVSKK